MLIAVYDVKGRCRIKEHAVFDHLHWHYRLDISRLNGGVYLLVLPEDKRAFVVR